MYVHTGTRFDTEKKSAASVSTEHSVLCKMPSFSARGVNTSWLPPGSTRIKPFPCTAPLTFITRFKKECALSISYAVPRKNPTQGHIWPVIISWFFFLSLWSSLQKRTTVTAIKIFAVLTVKQWLGRFHRGGQTGEWSISYARDKHTEKVQWLYYKMWLSIKLATLRWGGEESHLSHPLY